MSEWVLPDRPEEPLASDCCNSGCSPCIREVYEDLLKDWEDQCRRIKSGTAVSTVEKVECRTILQPTKYSVFRVVSITQVTSDTNIYRFQAVSVEEKKEDDKEVEYTEVRGRLNLKPSQHLMLQGKEIVSGTEKNFTRAYTPVNDEAISLKGCFDVIIKLYAGGKMSQYLQNLSVGCVTLWRGPYGGFSYEANTFKRIVMLCAGTGVAPLYSLAQSIVKNERDDTVVKMSFCCKDANSIILRNEIYALQAFWNFSADIYVAGSVKSKFTPYYGEILKTVRLCRDAVASELGGANRINTMVLICGSTQFCSEMKEYVEKCQVDPDHIYIF